MIVVFLVCSICAMHIVSANFVKSATSWKECPEQFLPEFAFIGRSNVGKSALINMLVQRNGLAKSSSTPGKTKLINFFCINDALFFVDLPWYGYAKSKVTERAKWIDRTQDYFHNRPCLMHVFVLVDGSIPPQDIDREFCHALQQENIPFSLVVTKTDKTTQSDLHKHMTWLKQALQSHFPVLPQIFLTSSKKSRGREKLLEYISLLASDLG